MVLKWTIWVLVGTDPLFYEVYFLCWNSVHCAPLSWPRQVSEQSNNPRKWLYMKCLGYCLQISAITKCISVTGKRFLHQPPIKHRCSKTSRPVSVDMPIANLLFSSKINMEPLMYNSTLIYDSDIHTLDIFWKVQFHNCFDVPDQKNSSQ